MSTVQQEMHHSVQRFVPGAIYAVSALRVGCGDNKPTLWTHHRRWQNKEQNHGMKHYSFHASTMSKTVAITKPIAKMRREFETCPRVGAWSRSSSAR